jgi:sensor histidine kinase YesM
MKVGKIGPVKLFFLLLLMGIPGNLYYCPDCFEKPVLAVMSVLHAGLFWSLLWVGNSLWSEYLDRRINWVEYPTRRLVVGVAVIIGYSLLAIFLNSYWFYILYLGRSFTQFWQDEIMIYATFQSMFFTLVISLFMHGRAFLGAWRQSAINEQKLRAEILSTRYEALRNQVNPHFLFNSLNVLTSLVYKDQDLAAHFIKKLSDVYRYVLDTGRHELVPLESELAFLKDYVFLLKIRFDESLQVDIHLEPGLEAEVPPLALQLLIENAIKHNVITEEAPLRIEIRREGDFLVVRNTLQARKTTAASTGIGLNNIFARYQLLTNRPVLVEPDGSYFTVKLPLISPATAIV